ncbi:MAG: hypothetical protein QM689_07490 [Oscillospiraceae bacterium]
MNTVTKLLEQQFYNAFDALKQHADACPDALWNSGIGGARYWTHLVHALMGTYFWMRADYAAGFVWDLPLPELLRGRLVEDAWEYSDGEFMTRAEAQFCFDAVAARCAQFFAALDDETLAAHPRESYPCTYADIIASQIRHIAYHTGMCAAFLNAADLDEPAWVD